MIINQQLTGINPVNPRMTQGANNAATETPAPPATSESGSNPEIVDTLDISSHRATILENLNASSGMPPAPGMAGGLMDMLKVQLSREAGSSLQAQIKGIRPEAARLLED